MVEEGMESQVCLEFTPLVRGEAGTEGETEVCLLWGGLLCSGLPTGTGSECVQGGDADQACFCLRGTVSLLLGSGSTVTSQLQQMRYSSFAEQLKRELGLLAPNLPKCEHGKEMN